MSFSLCLVNFENDGYFPVYQSLFYSHSKT